jgi:vacuolar-type H+-ATPase subunit I/STV1
MKNLSIILSVILLFTGIYLVFFYDVPDADGTLNFFTGWFLVITGVASALVNIFWSEH